MSQETKDKEELEFSAWLKQQRLTAYENKLAEHGFTKISDLRYHDTEEELLEFLQNDCSMSKFSSKKFMQEIKKKWNFNKKPFIKPPPSHKPMQNYLSKDDQFQYRSINNVSNEGVPQLGKQLGHGPSFHNRLAHLPEIRKQNNKNIKIQNNIKNEKQSSNKWNTFVNDLSAVNEQQLNDKWNSDHPETNRFDPETYKNNKNGNKNDTFEEYVTKGDYKKIHEKTNSNNNNNINNNEITPGDEILLGMGDIIRNESSQSQNIENNDEEKEDTMETNENNHSKNLTQGNDLLIGMVDCNVSYNNNNQNTQGNDLLIGMVNDNQNSNEYSGTYI